MAKLPQDFKKLFWSYDYSLIDSDKHQKVVITSLLNYGDLNHWRWLIRTYGKDKLKRLLTAIPTTEFRKPVLILLSLLLNINKFKYVSRSDKIKAKKGV